MNFTTTLMLDIKHAPLELLASALDDEELDDEIEVEVEVDYHPGYYQPGCRSGHPDNWTPDEGEDPEIESVTVEETGKDITRDLSPEQLKALEKAAWEHQSEPDW
jgi:hypothetical protein